MNPDLTTLTKAIDRIAAALHKGAWDYAATVTIVITLVVLIKYTYETFMLRVAAQRQNEISVMPMLGIVIRASDRNVVRLHSVGSAPAFNLSIDRQRYQNGELFVEYEDTVLAGGQTSQLRFYFQEGSSTTGLAPDAVYEWINTGKLPSPLDIIVRCRGVNSKDYAFTFRFRTDAGRLKVSFEGMVEAR